jgi:hypothetical protein
MNADFHAEKFGEAVGVLIRDTAAPLRKRIDALEQRLGEIEGHGLKYAGVYQRANAYARGNVVTHDGSAWICIAEKSLSAPGASAEWQLMVKAGRDGVSAR